MTALTRGEHIELTHYLKDNADIGPYTERFEVQEVEERATGIVVSLMAAADPAGSEWTLRYYPEHNWRATIEDPDGKEWRVINAEADLPAQDA